MEQQEPKRKESRGRRWREKGVHNIRGIRNFVKIGIFPPSLHSFLSKNTFQNTKPAQGEISVIAADTDTAATAGTLLLPGWCSSELDYHSWQHKKNWQPLAMENGGKSRNTKNRSGLEK